VYSPCHTLNGQRAQRWSSEWRKAHDILAAADLFGERDVDGATTAEIANRIGERRAHQGSPQLNGKHPLGLINTTLISKMEAGQFKLNLGECALRSIVETMMVATLSPLPQKSSRCTGAYLRLSRPWGRVRHSGDLRASLRDLLSASGYPVAVRCHPRQLPLPTDEQIPKLSQAVEAVVLPSVHFTVFGHAS
jgi:hypothetical protein